MATFVKLDTLRINLDNITYLDERVEVGVVVVHLINEPTLFLPWNAGGELLLKVVDVRALGTHVKLVADGE